MEQHIVSPRSQGAIETFNKSTIEKLRYLKLEKK